MRAGAEEEGVEAAAVTVCAGAGGPGALDLADIHRAFRNRRIHGRSAELGIEQATGGERNVAVVNLAKLAKALSVRPRDLLP